VELFYGARYHIKKRAEVLGIITKILLFCCCGTHGTTSILGHILYESGADVTAFIGGIVNYNSNLGRQENSYCSGG
jgi:UDP-N-acetylmuramate--alanine ligase